MAQMIVYGGAVMVLFIFVIMLLNAGRKRQQQILVRANCGVPLLLAVPCRGCVFDSARLPGLKEVFRSESWWAEQRKTSDALFTTYLLPFEVISILILIAILGAVVLAQKEID